MGRAVTHSSSELLPACSAPRRTPRSGSGQGGPRRCRPRGRPRRAPTRGNGGQPQGQRAPRAGRRHDGPGGQSRVPSVPRCPLSSGRAARSVRARSFPGRTHRGPRAERAARSGGGRKGRRRRRRRRRGGGCGHSSWRIGRCGTAAACRCRRKVRAGSAGCVYIVRGGRAVGRVSAAGGGGCAEGEADRAAAGTFGVASSSCALHRCVLQSGARGMVARSVFAVVSLERCSGTASCVGHCGCCSPSLSARTCP